MVPWHPVLHRGQITTGSMTTDVDFADVHGDIGDEIDAAYRAKYGSYPGPVKSITSEVARSTTLKLIPRKAD